MGNTGLHLDTQTLHVLCNQGRGTKLPIGQLGVGVDITTPGHNSVIYRLHLGGYFFVKLIELAENEQSANSTGATHWAKKNKRDISNS